MSVLGVRVRVSVRVGVAGVFAGTADDDSVRLDRDRHRAVSRPVLRVRRVVLHGRVEPQPVAILAVIERALARLRPPSAPAAATAPAPAAAPAAAALRPLVVVAVAVGAIAIAIL